MNANSIRKILNGEVIALQNTNNNKAANALQEFANWATDQELVRFREIVIGTDPADWVEDPKNKMTA